jgi:hypothetical protein
MSARSAPASAPASVVDYLHAPDGQGRRIARAPAAGADLAGLAPSSRYHGRATPLKGKGAPPADDKEAPAAAGGIRMVAGHSGAATDVLLARAGEAGAAPAASGERRPSVRTFNSAFASSMQGASAVVAEEVRGVWGNGAQGAAARAPCRPPSSGRGRRT